MPATRPWGVGGPTAATHTPTPSDHATHPHGRRGFADPRVRLTYAVLYTVGVALTVIGCAGAMAWAPLLWCAATGFVLITVAFAVRAGRF